MILTIDGCLPTINELVGKHHMKYAKTKKSASYLVQSAIKMQGYEIRGEPPYHFIFRHYRSDKRTDPDNIAGGSCKIVLDQFQRSGLIKNDGWTQVKSIKHEFYQCNDDFTEVEALPVQGSIVYQKYRKNLKNQCVSDE